MLGCGADLFFDDIEVVEQPFSGRSYAPVLLDVLGQQAVHPPQYPFVLGQARQEAIARTPVGKLVHACQDLAVLLHLGGAEQLRPEGELLVDALSRRAVSGQACPEMGKGALANVAARLHARCPLELERKHETCPGCGRR
ncbi:hypothetical protein DSECCO2_362060 [anaerobic digester metagenome]